jgi:hypothetical protein
VPDSGGEDSSFENENKLLIRLSRRQRRLADWASLIIMVRLAVLEPLPFVRRCRRRIVAKVLLVGLVVRRGPQSSAEKS